MPAPYLGHLSPEIQELSERLLRLQVAQAERAFEQEGRAATRTTGTSEEGITSAMQKAGEKAEEARVSWEQMRREAAAQERTASVLERQQDLAEKKQDWEMVKFQIEERGKTQREQIKAYAPMKVEKGASVYNPLTNQFESPELRFPQTYTTDDMAEILILHPQTKQPIASIPKTFRVKATVMQGPFGSFHVFDENSGEYLGRHLSGYESHEYALALDKATSAVDVALINERSSKGVARIQAAASIQAAGITTKGGIEEAKIKAQSDLAKMLSDEKIAMWGIQSTWKVETLRNAIENGKLVIASGRLQLDRDTLNSLNLNKTEERNLAKWLAMHKGDIEKMLGIMGLEIRREELAFKREQALMDNATVIRGQDLKKLMHDADLDFDVDHDAMIKAIEDNKNLTAKQIADQKHEVEMLAEQTRAKSVAVAEQTAKWEHEDRRDRNAIHQYEAESTRSFNEAKKAEGVRKNDLYEKSLNNDYDVNILRARAYDRLTAAQTKEVLAGTERNDMLANSKILLDQKEMWYKNELIRIADLEKKLETLRDEYARAEGDAKLRLQSLVAFAQKNLMEAQGKALEVRSKLDTEQADYDRERDKILDAETVMKNKIWAKMLEKGSGSLTKEERLAVGMPATTPFVAETEEQALHFYEEKQKILAQWGPYGEGTWEQRKKVMEYEMTLEAAFGIMTQDQKIKFEQEKAKIDTKVYKAKAGIDLQAEKDLVDYKAEKDKYELIKDPKTGNTIFVDKNTLQAEATFNPAGEEQPDPEYHYFADNIAGVMHVYDSGREIFTYPIGKAPTRKEKENIFMKLWGQASRAAGLEVSGIKTTKDKENVARAFIAAVETDPDLLPGEKALYKQWAGILAGEEVSLSDLIKGEAPMAEIPGGISFEDFLKIYNEATSPEAAITPSTVPAAKAPPKKVKGAGAEEMMRFIDNYKRSHPKWTHDEVREAVRKKFGI